MNVQRPTLCGVKKQHSMTDAATATRTPSPTSSVNSESTDVGSVPEPPETSEEFGGRDGPDPTRYGDWEKNGRCIDF